MIQVKIKKKKKNSTRGVSKGMFYTQGTWKTQNLFNLELIIKGVTIHRSKKRCSIYTNYNLN